MDQTTVTEQTPISRSKEIPGSRTENIVQKERNRKVESLHRRRRIGSTGQT